MPSIGATDISKIRLLEQGSAPASPPSGYGYVYAKSDGLLYFLNDAGVEYALGQGLSNPMTTANDLIIGGASGTPARLAKGTDGQVLTVDPTTHNLVWADPAGGGAADAVTTGSSAAEIPGLAGSPDRTAVGGANYANEFDSTTSGVTWSSAPATSDSHTTFPSHLYAHATDTTDRYALAAYAPAGDFDARMKLGVGSGVASGFVSAGLVVTNSDNSARVGLYYVPNPGGGVGVILLQLFNDNSQVGGNITISGTFDDGYLRITRTGTTIKYYYSANGKTWHLLNSATKTFTAAQIGLRFFANNSDGEVAVDWIRATG